MKVLLTRIFMAVAASGFAAGAAHAQNPYTAPDNTWISLSGSVVEARDDAFDLDYGKGIVTVEMDDWDWYPDGKGILEGDKVTVYGMVDDDLFEKTTIEASSVYVENLNTTFYASAADEENATIFVPSTPIVVSWTEVVGTVTKVHEDEFVINSGTKSITVETEEMLYNPLDDKGYQKIKAGDRVKVIGEFDDDLFEGRELVADTIITLRKDRGS